jgi:hypothetical protein
MYVTRIERCVPRISAPTRGLGFLAPPWPGVLSRSNVFLRPAPLPSQSSSHGQTSFYAGLRCPTRPFRCNPVPPILSHPGTPHPQPPRYPYPRPLTGWLPLLLFELPPGSPDFSKKLHLPRSNVFLYSHPTLSIVSLFTGRAYRPESPPHFFYNYSATRGSSALVIGFTPIPIFSRGTTDRDCCSRSRLVVGSLVVIAAFPCPPCRPPQYSHLVQSLPRSFQTTQLVFNPAGTHLYDPSGSFD